MFPTPNLHCPACPSPTSPFPGPSRVSVTMCPSPCPQGVCVWEGTPEPEVLPSAPSGHVYWATAELLPGEPHLLCLPLLSMEKGWPPCVGACGLAVEMPVDMGTQGGAENQRGAMYSSRLGAVGS